MEIRPQKRLKSAKNNKYVEEMSVLYFLVFVKDH